MLHSVKRYVNGSTSRFGTTGMLFRPTDSIRRHGCALNVDTRMTTSVSVIENGSAPRVEPITGGISMPISISGKKTTRRLGIRGDAKRLRTRCKSGDSEQFWLNQLRSP